VRIKPECVVSELSFALSVMGDRWTLVIMDVLRHGVHHFDEIQARTGISSHLLRNRLRRMEADGLIERHLYHARPPRYAYRGTAKGNELDRIVLALCLWANRWA
jgi:DNA-binding HxlR family transcriptional regulator